MKRRGFILADILVSLSLFGIILTMAGSLFVLANHYFVKANAQADNSTSAMTGLNALTKDIHESNIGGIVTNGSSILIVSARDSSGQFHTNTQGSIVWQKWICYYIVNTMLVRNEGNPTGTTFGTTTVPAIPGSWLPAFQSMNMGKTYGSNFQSLTFAVANPTAIQAILHKTYQDGGESYTSVNLNVEVNN
jgi:hypothetical protein